MPMPSRSLAHKPTLLSPPRRPTSSNLVRARWREQLRHLDAEEVRKADEGTDGEVLPARFDPLDVLERHPELLGHLLLCEVRVRSQLGDAAADTVGDGAGVQGLHAPGLTVPFLCSPIPIAEKISTTPECQVQRRAVQAGCSDIGFTCSATKQRRASGAGAEMRSDLDGSPDPDMLGVGELSADGTGAAGRARPSSTAG